MFSGSVEVSVITEISGGLKSLKGIRGTEPLVDRPRVTYTWPSPTVDSQLTID